MADAHVFNGGVGPDNAEDQTLERLAAARAALDPARREWRSDILLAAAVESLARHGDMAVPALLEVLNRTWRTRAITEPELAGALDRAFQARMIRRVTDLDGTDRWQVSPATKAEADTDRDWARAVIGNFENEVAKRLAETGSEMDQSRSDRVAQHLIRALATGCGPTPKVERSSPEFLRPVTFDKVSMRGCLRDIQPRSIREAVGVLMEAAIDPDDEFGDELVHMLLVGSILQSFIAKRDLGHQIRLDAGRLLLDTTVLVDLIDDGTPHQQVMRNLVELSLRLGMQIVVAEHTLTEWERLWRGAEAEDPEKYDDADIPANTDRLAANPFIRQWLRLKATDPRLHWRRFATEKHSLTPVLTTLGITVRPHGNTTEDDRQLVDEAERVVLELADSEDHPGHRRAPAARADAESLGMLARWRRKYQTDPPSIFFVAREYLTGQAYKRLRPGDPTPLTVRPEAWVTYAASLVADDPEERAEIARIVGASTQRESFFGMATSYTLDDAVQLSRMLAHDHVLDIEDARAAVQLDLLDTLEGGPSQDVLTVGSTVIQRRAARRDARAHRLETQAKEATARVEAERSTHRAEVAELSQQVVDLHTRVGTEATKATDGRRWKRAFAVFVGLVILGGVMGGLIAAGTLAGKWQLAAYALGALYLWRGIDFIINLEQSWLTAVIAEGAAIGYAVLGAIFSGH